MNQPHQQPIDDPRTDLEAEGWAHVVGKTGAAIADLVVLMKGIVADGKIDDLELRELLLWRSRHQTVVRRQPLKPFTEFLDSILADGEMSSDEHIDLLAWGRWMDDVRQRMESTSEKAFVAPEPPPQRARSDWRSDPITDKQRNFAEELGAKPRDLKGMTKGQASALIDKLLMQRDMAKYDTIADRMGDRISNSFARRTAHAGSSHRRAHGSYSWEWIITAGLILGVLLLVFFVILPRV
jgi:hypothetical protein